MAIAGYTNAGKSSLLNALTSAGVLVENALFATLDATVRRTETEDGRVYTLTDTVGFVRNLPHQLVKHSVRRWKRSARPTSSSTSSTGRTRIRQVNCRPCEMCSAMSASATCPEIVVFNKADLIDEDERLVLRGLQPHAHFVSSRSGEGIAELRAAVEEALRSLPSRCMP